MIRISTRTPLQISRRSITSQMAPSSSASSSSRTRIEMIGRHVSTSSSLSAAPASGGGGGGGGGSGVKDATKKAFEEKESLVIASSNQKLRTLTLNRPKALNALNLEMFEALRPPLEKWEKQESNKIVLLKGEGRAFCAGGDVVTIVKAIQDPSKRLYGAEFFKNEYETDNFIAKMRKPVIAIMDGITMGGGVGLSVHNPFKIATEKTVMAMPETTIGLFPDVGASFLLSRLDGEMGLYLGLTSERLTGWGVFQAGVASHFVPSSRLAELEARLAELVLDSLPSSTSPHDIIDQAIEEFSGPPPSSNEIVYDLTGAKRRLIDLCFGKDSVEGIVDTLKEVEQGKHVDEEVRRVANWKAGAGKNVSEEEIEKEKEGLKEWARKTRETIEMRSPTSVKVSFLAIREGKKLDIDEAFQMDYRLATTFCDPEIVPDFVTGVTHLLINKQKTRADWKPPTLTDPSLNYDSLRKTFFSSQPPPSSTASKAPKLSLSPTPPYKSYPYAKFALPPESMIRDVVKGDWKNSGSFALKDDEVVRVVEREWKGKVGVRSKVIEVLERMTVRDKKDGYLKWRP